jgi:hypothetical protein
MTVEQSHTICDRLETALKREVDGIQVIIHVEPGHKAKDEGRAAGMRGSGFRNEPGLRRPLSAAKFLERHAKHIRIDIAAGDGGDHVVAFDFIAMKQRSGKGDGAARFRDQLEP